MMNLGRREMERGPVTAKFSLRPSWNSSAPGTVPTEAVTDQARLSSDQEDEKSREHSWDRAAEFAEVHRLG